MSCKRGLLHHMSCKRVLLHHIICENRSFFIIHSWSTMGMSHVTSQEWVMSHHEPPNGCESCRTSQEWVMSNITGMSHVTSQEWVMSHHEPPNVGGTMEMKKEVKVSCMMSCGCARSVNVMWMYDVIWIVDVWCHMNCWCMMSYELLSHIDHVTASYWIMWMSYFTSQGAQFWRQKEAIFFFMVSLALHVNVSYCIVWMSHVTSQGALFWALVTMETRQFFTVAYVNHVNAACWVVSHWVNESCCFMRMSHVAAEAAELWQ